MSILKKEKGFTLIEIVLVLAIAGLLLVIVFLAVSGAQKSRRDTQRKNDNARLVAQIENYASNNAGGYGGLTNTMLNAGGTYALTNFNDPSSGLPYAVQTIGTSPPAGACPTPNVYVVITAATRTVTSTMCLEQGFNKLTNN